jgi:hypothetical protein
VQGKSPVIPDYIHVQDDIALLQSANGDHAAALQMAAKALASAEKYASGPAVAVHAAQLGNAWAVLAIMQGEASQKDAARKSAEKASDIWDSVNNPGLLTTFRISMANNKRLLADLP